MAEPISRAKWEKSDPSGALLLCSAHPGLRLLPVLWWVHPHVLLDHLVKVFNQSHSCWQVCESPTTATRQTGAQILSGGKQGAFHQPHFLSMPWGWTAPPYMAGCHSLFKQLYFEWSFWYCSLPAKRKRWSSCHSSHFLSSMDKYI